MIDNSNVFGGNSETLLSYSKESILADKLSVLATKKVCRRMKDLIDVYFISLSYDGSFKTLISKINSRLKNTGRVLDYDNLYLMDSSNLKDMKHAFDLFKCIPPLNKEFEEVYERVVNFTFPIYCSLDSKLILSKSWDIEGDMDLILRDEILKMIKHGTICLESALYCHKLSSYYDYKPSVFIDSGIEVDTKYFSFIKNINGNKDIEPFKDGFKITSIERTFCDLVIYKRRPDFIIEGLRDYCDIFSSQDKLIKTAREYGVEKEIVSYLGEIDDYFYEA